MKIKISTSKTAWLPLAAALLALCLWAGPARSQGDADMPYEDQAGGAAEKTPPRFELGEIVVTASGTQTSVAEIPKNVTVITEADIQNAAVTNLGDLLNQEAGVQVTDLFGNAKLSTVDIRGMGETASSNVVVMVDGFRLNSWDLSGPDLSTVPLDSIGRIEIVRGAGSVLYGSGAVGGVVNVITKKPVPGHQGRASASAGSFDSFGANAQALGMVKDFSYNLFAGHSDTDGYRDNGYLRKNNAKASLGYFLFDKLELSATGSYHDDAYGLPGPVSLEQSEDSRGRRQTLHPQDNGATKDKRAALAASWDGGEWGKIRISRGWRFRDNDYLLGYSPLIDRSEQTNRITEDTKNWDVKYELNQVVAHHKNRLLVGLDQFSDWYVRTENPRDLRQNSSFDSLGLYIWDRFHIVQSLALTAGYRHNRFDADFRTDERVLFGTEKRWQNGTVTKESWSHNVGEAGLVWEATPWASLFGGFSQSFRVPNADEFARAEEGLSPQEGNHWELGTRLAKAGRAEAEATLFYSTTSDEILFGEDPVTLEPVNRNADQDTERRGVELQAKAYPVDTVYLWANYTYTQAEFAQTRASIPLVPEHQASLGVEWDALDWLRLAASGNYVGERPDGNDVTGDRYPELPGYATLDAKATVTWKRFKAWVGATNLTDEQYSAVAYSAGYYPMPCRAWYAGAEVRW